jgi:hypothetical protein
MSIYASSEVSLGTAAPCSCTIAAANAFEGVIVSVIFVMPSITGAAWAPLADEPINEYELLRD